MNIDEKREAPGLSASVVALYGRLADGDVAALLEGLDRDIEWVVPDGLHYGGVYRGRESVLTNVFARFETEWVGFAVQPDEIFEAGDVVIALGHYRAANRVTGRPMTSRFAHVWRLSDGVPVRFETIPDTHAMVRTMTVEPS
ncbi:nuclear transport factor 2 family protein [Actinoplanes sp. DH11]|uniref:nuclear transport factor 2 family protein n=1 Tax=Actinoplanes sp. DH11 TaxID=2857011 RepID=UPI001E2F2106|nr:nuclear transport factor 2 family protein [Actinoplanes sp. DH11]